MRKPKEFDNFPKGLANLTEFGPYQAVIMIWVDGDTCYAFVDVGFNTYLFVVLRVAGLDAPEIFRPRDEAEKAHGTAALEYARKLCPEGSPVVLYTGADTQTFGRYVATITLADGTDLQVLPHGTIASASHLKMPLTSRRQRSYANEVADASSTSRHRVRSSVRNRNRRCRT
jgi:endonuclease YncB( thermonuclease family)